MARHRDPVVSEVKRIRRRISKRLMEEDRKGRLHQAVRELEHRGEALVEEAVGPAKARRLRSRKQA